MDRAATDDGLLVSLRGLDRDGRVLFALRTLRMFAYGSLAVVLVLYLAAIGLDPLAIGAILTLTLVGDTAISLWLTTSADRLGRRRVLMVGAALMLLAGLAFAATDAIPLLILAGAIGVISPTGNEVGPFLAVEQAALSQTIPGRRRTATFAWYNLVGYLATATGALAAGIMSQALLGGGATEPEAYRSVVIGYARDRRAHGGRSVATRSGDRGVAGVRARLTVSAVDSGSAARKGSSSGCPRSSPSTRSRAASSHRA